MIQLYRIVKRTGIALLLLSLTTGVLLPIGATAQETDSKTVRVG